MRKRHQKELLEKVFFFFPYEFSYILDDNKRKRKDLGSEIERLGDELKKIKLQIQGSNRRGTETMEEEDEEEKSEDIPVEDTKNPNKKKVSGCKKVSQAKETEEKSDEGSNESSQSPSPKKTPKNKGKPDSKGDEEKGSHMATRSGKKKK